MWRKTSGPTVVLLGLQSIAVSAADSFHSSGPVTACPGYHLTNSTEFDLNITPDNGTIYFHAQGLSTTAAQVTLGLAIIADGSEKYKSNFDPCTFVTGAELCPAADGIAGINASLSIPEDLMGTLDLPTNEDLKAQFWVNAIKSDPQQHMACVETTLRSDASTAGGSSTNSTSIGGESTGSANSTSEGNSSTSENGTDSADTTKDSGASSLQAVWSIAMLSIAIWFL